MRPKSLYHIIENNFAALTDLDAIVLVDHDLRITAFRQFDEKNNERMFHKIRFKVHLGLPLLTEQVEQLFTIPHPDAYFDGGRYQDDKNVQKNARLFNKEDVLLKYDSKGINLGSVRDIGEGNQLLFYGGFVSFNHELRPKENWELGLTRYCGHLRNDGFMFDILKVPRVPQEVLNYSKNKEETEKMARRRAVLGPWDIIRSERVISEMVGFDLSSREYYVQHL
jgi:hypothetical protein